MGYVPSQYDGHRRIGSDGAASHADRIAAKLKSGDYVAKNPDGTINESWRPKRASI